MQTKRRPYLNQPSRILVALIAAAAGQATLAQSITVSNAANCTTVAPTGATAGASCGSTGVVINPGGASNL